MKGATPDEALWAALRQAEGRFFAARRLFLAEATDHVGTLRGALGTAAQRGTALRLLPSIPVAERQLLFDQLVELCSVGHSDVLLCRDAVLALPRDWVLERIERSAAPVLSAGGAEEYRRLLELYAELDVDLTRRLATEALAHSDADVREAGGDFLSRLPA